MPTPDRRPRLTPATADARRAVRDALTRVRATTRATDAPDGTDVLVALSGGPDSLALAAATAFEAPAAGLRAGAVIVDHGLQDGSAEVAARAAEQARQLGLEPVIVSALHLAGAASAPVVGGPEARARAARYAALDAALARTGATAVLLGHTLDDQAETVLLGLARGAGATSLSGMAVFTPPPGAAGDHHDHGAPASTASDAPLTPGTRIRPFLGLRRAQTVQACTDAGLEPWNDPHNASRDYTRVRVRAEVLPVLERELGPGIAEALARTAEQLREDDGTLHAMALETIEDLVEPAEAGIAISARALEANPPALRNRIIRYVVESEFGVSLSRAQTLAVAALVTDWHGQKGVDLPGVRVVRQGRRLEFARAEPGGE